jgi:hypothetical protein
MDGDFDHVDDSSAVAWRLFSVGHPSRNSNIEIRNKHKNQMTKVQSQG